MKLLPIILHFLIMNQATQHDIPKTYLALGDSYTIGESLPIYESYPYQTVQLLREKGVQITAPEIIAKTGWTTDELAAAIDQTRLIEQYDYVSLLIGVNNQYRGRKSDEYAMQFEELLKRAISFSTNGTSHVFVISIPDWGATPFAEGRDKKKIAEEINAFNDINKSISEKYGVGYIEITEGSRDAKKNPSLVARDKLHPSGTEYSKWANKLAEKIFEVYQR
jgi:lysophospholipase L1-like esterase